MEINHSFYLETNRFHNEGSLITPWIWRQVVDSRHKLLASSKRRILSKSSAGRLLKFGGQTPPLSLWIERSSGKATSFLKSRESWPRLRPTVDSGVMNSLGLSLSTLVLTPDAVPKTITRGPMTDSTSVHGGLGDMLDLYWSLSVPDTKLQESGKVLKGLTASSLSDSGRKPASTIRMWRRQPSTSTGTWAFSG